MQGQHLDERNQWPSFHALTYPLTFPLLGPEYLKEHLLPCTLLRKADPPLCSTGWEDLVAGRGTEGPTPWWPLHCGTPYPGMLTWHHHYWPLAIGRRSYSGELFIDSSHWFWICFRLWGIGFMVLNLCCGIFMWVLLCDVFNTL